MPGIETMEEQGLRMMDRWTLARRVTAALLALTAVSGVAALDVSQAAAPIAHQAQVEARVPFSPQVFVGSDDQQHVAYEIRLTSFQDADDLLKLVRVAVSTDVGTEPLTVIEGAGLYGLLNRAAQDPVPNDGMPIPASHTVSLFLWLTLPKGALPSNLKHQLTFLTSKGAVQRADDVRVAVNPKPPIRISAPLRGGRWLAVEGPGNALSHHWGSMVAIDGTLSIPQRFAIDWFGLDDANHSLSSQHEELAASVDEDWIGYGQDVLAVADGVVADARDGIANGKPLAPLEVPDDLTARSLYGNFVVLKIAPGVYAHYAHLKAGSVKLQVGQRVRRGAVIAQLGQTGSAGAPHLHFHISDLPSFEHSQGLPFVIDTFTLHGRSSIGATFDPTKPNDVSGERAGMHRNQLPLDGSVVTFSR